MLEGSKSLLRRLGDKFPQILPRRKLQVQTRFFYQKKGNREERYRFLVHHIQYAICITVAMSQSSR